MDVSKTRATPKWMVKIMENLIKMDDLGETHYLRSAIHIFRISDPTNGQAVWSNWTSWVSWFSKQKTASTFPPTEKKNNNHEFD